MNKVQKQRAEQVESIQRFNRIIPRSDDPEAKHVLDKALDAYECEPTWERQVSFWRLAALIILALSLGFGLLRSQSMDRFNNCGPKGDNGHPNVQALDILKNRYTLPKLVDIRRTVTIDALLAPGSDVNRFSSDYAAEITGYVVDVRPGGIESCNCHAKDPQYRDTHIVVALDKNHRKNNQLLIVEVTPRLRKMASDTADWSTATLEKKLKGRTVTFQGWLFFDAEHTNAAENTHPGGKHNWRATSWELHPVTSIEVQP